jgi:hypothetical protein
MAKISETHEVRVDLDDGSYEFVAEPSDGRLVIRELGEGGEEICAIRLSDPEELTAFFAGLRRIFASDPELRGQAGLPPKREVRAQPLPAGGAPSKSEAKAPPEDESEEDREAIIERARTKNPNAFKRWTRDEEAEVVRRFEAGDTLDAIARDHARSRRAIELRLEKLGKLDPS